MRTLVNVYDTKRGRIAFARMSEYEAHVRVDTLNGMAGYRRYRVNTPGEMIGAD